MYSVEEILNEQNKLIKKQNEAKKTLRYMQERPNEFNKKLMPVFQKYINELEELIQAFNGTLSFQGDL